MGIIINLSRLRSLSRQLSRSYHHHQISTPFFAIHSLNYQIKVSDRIYPVVFQKPNSEFPINVRFFAAPVQAKPKQEVKDPSGPRLNEKITADIVRLVSDEGHDVVSRNEALQRAAALDLDLVEVDRNAKPPVCKIMDYHREKYKQKVKDKDRVKKSKSEVTLRQGDCKEVRISMKIEQKDLEMKANTVKKMLERGYRVKCMVTGKEEKAQKNRNGKEEDEEAIKKRIVKEQKEQDDMRGLIASLYSLIEDVSIVESGPRHDKRQSYIVVRHIKFGPSKKGGSSKKASKITTNSDAPNSMGSDSLYSIEEDKIADQPGSQIDDEAPLEENRYKREEISVSMDNRYKRPENTPVIENRYKRPENAPGLENRYKRPESPPVIDNRYKRPENSPMVDNRYNRANNSTPENRYNRENNAPVSDNRYNRVNNAPPVTENRYSRVNNSTPSDNRYIRESKSPVTENRYRRVNQYNANAEGGRVNDPDIREQPQPQAENRYRNGNNFDQKRHPRPQGSPPTTTYSDGR